MPHVIVIIAHFSQHKFHNLPLKSNSLITISYCINFRPHMIVMNVFTLWKHTPLFPHPVIDRHVAACDYRGKKTQHKLRCNTPNTSYLGTDDAEGLFKCYHCSNMLMRRQWSSLGTWLGNRRGPLSKAPNPQLFPGTGQTGSLYALTSL